MLRNPKFFRIAMFMFGVALVTPVAIALTSDIASASGYIFMSGRDGEMLCLPGSGDDCGGAS